MSQDLIRSNKLDGLFPISFVLNHVNMLPEYSILLVVFMSLALVFTLIILVFRSGRSKPVASNKKLNIEKHITPFITVHQSLLISSKEELDSESAEKLKLKIEGFKNRNQFYQL